MDSSMAIMGFGILVREKKEDLQQNKILVWPECRDRLTLIFDWTDAISVHLSSVEMSSFEVWLWPLLHYVERSLLIGEEPSFTLSALKSTLRLSFQLEGLNFLLGSRRLDMALMGPLMKRLW